MRRRASRCAAAGTAFALLDAHLYGFMQQEVSLPFEGEADLAALGAELLGPEVRAAYPHFTAFAEGRALQPGYSFGNEFEVTLDLVLGALAGLRGPRPDTPASATATVSRAMAPIEVTVPVLGVDGCPGGWVGAAAGARRAPAPGGGRPDRRALVETVRADLDVQVVGIDIPIGLPDSSIRQADVLARRALPGRASSVFTTLTRPAYLAADRAAADAVNRGLSGQGVGAQAFALRAKILEVDAWLRTPADGRRRRGAPGGVLRDDDRRADCPESARAEGQQARLDALARRGHRPPVGAQGQRVRHRRRARRLRGRVVGRTAARRARRGGCRTRRRCSRTASGPRSWSDAVADRRQTHAPPMVRWAAAVRGLRDDRTGVPHDHRLPRRVHALRVVEGGARLRRRRGRPQPRRATRSA